MQASRGARILFRCCSSRLDHEERPPLVEVGDLRAGGLRAVPTAALLARSHLPRPERERRADDHGEDHDERVQLPVLYEVLEAHTRTSDDCYLCLWEGIGDLHPAVSASPSIVATASGERGRERRPPSPPGVGRAKGRRARSEVPTVPRALAGAGDWGAADMWPGHPRGTCRPPSSGSPIMPGASPTTSTHTGQGSGRTRTSSISSLPSHGWMESVPTQVTSSRHSTEEPRPAVEDCSSSIGHPGEARPSCTNQSASPTPRRVEPRSPTVSQPRRRTVGRVFAATHGESCRSVEFSERDAGTSCPSAAIYSRAAQ